MINPNLEATNEARYLSENNEKQRNLELAVSKSLVRIAEQLGMPESIEMMDLRESFAREIDPSDERVGELVGSYIDLCHQIPILDNDSEPTLALCILLVVFYLPRQTQSIIAEFNLNCHHVSQFINIPLAVELGDLLGNII